jgi:CheY-like chemotaxis protein
MSLFRLLFVEDNTLAIETFKQDLERFKVEREIEDCFVQYATSLDEAVKQLDNSFDGAIIDLKLGKDDSKYSGNEIVDKILNTYRIPIVIYTSTPQQQESWPRHIKVYVRGQSTYLQVLNDLDSLYRTGITKVAGGRGLIEEKIDHIFWQHLLPLLDVWKKYNKDESISERTLLRFTVNHLMEHLDDDSDTFIPDEVYITPPIRGNSIRTGCIVKQKQSEKHFVILTPACDLVIRQSGQAKTSDILLCEIEPLESAKNLCQATKKDKREIFFKDLANNNYCPYYHFLPQVTRFPGGIINFRKVYTIQPSLFENTYSTPLHQISSAFIKDIVARFSVYYSRQGQPSFDASQWIESVI